MLGKTACGGLFLALVLAVGGCAEADADAHAGVDCSTRTCRIDLRQGSSASIGDLDVTVRRVSRGTVTIVAGGIAFVLDSKTDIDIGRLHLHLERLRGDVATVEFSS